MIRRIILAGAAIVVCNSVPLRAQDAPGELVLEIALRTYGVDSRVRGSAGDSGVEPFESYVWTDSTLCQVSASDNEPATAPAIGWHFTGRIHEQKGDEFVVSIKWRRVWSNSVRLTETQGASMNLRMRTDRRLELDAVGSLVPSPCGMAGARLEAAMVTRPRISVDRSVRVFGGAAEALAGSGQGGGARGGRGGAAGGGTTAGGAFVRPMPSASFDAEVWLVHTRPDGTESSQRHAMTVRESGASFTFPGVAVASESGPVWVEVSVNLRPILLRDSPGVMVGLSRRVGQSHGGSVKPMPLPAAGEVIAFELPALGGGVPVIPPNNRFEVRLRLK